VLDGWSALVTGGGSGIGLACAVRLATDGAAVTLAGRSEERLAAGVAAVEAAAPDARVQAVPTDVTDEAAVEAAVEPPPPSPAARRPGAERRRVRDDRPGDPDRHRTAGGARSTST
jgi:nucleoside-diphosphate-sugar epimerase